MSAAPPKFRAVFFGTPAFAVPCLEALCDVADVVGVVCQPDRPQGRGLELAPPPVKAEALARGLEVYQPTKVRDGSLAAWGKARSPDVALVVAYGRILPTDVLTAPRLGCVNVHASLLPAYRGAAPITWAIAHGESTTGVTLMKMDEGMDTGDILVMHSTPIENEETQGELTTRLALLGANMVRQELPRYVAGELTAHPQDHGSASVARVLRKEDGVIDFSQTACNIHNHIRAMNPWPGATTSCREKRLKVHTSKVVGERPVERPQLVPGQVVLADKSRVIVACGQGLLELGRVQLEGKKPVSAGDWFVGRGVAEGDILGPSSAK